jgi:hypothetical protein
MNNTYLSIPIPSINENTTHSPVTRGASPLVGEARSNDIFISNISMISNDNIISEEPITIALPYRSNRIVFVDTDRNIELRTRLLEKYRYILNIFFECWFITGSIVIAFFIVYFIIKNN